MTKATIAGATKAKATVHVPTDDTVAGLPRHIHDAVLVALQSPDRMKLDALTSAIEAAAKPSHVPSVTIGDHGVVTSVDHRGLVVVSAGDKGSTPSHEPSPPKSAFETKAAADLAQPKAYW